MQEMIGRTVGSYQIVDRLGQGGMASVYKAIQPSLNRNVALKILPPSLALDPTFVERFRREATAAAGLQHPNIVPIYDFGQDGDLLYIAMALILGGTLRERIGRIPLSLVPKIGAQVADALDYAHQRGIIHRDIKPNNILMAREDWVQLADFGIARVAESAGLTTTGTNIGTPEYMSPEQVKAEPVDGRSDIYSLGIVLYQMVTGRLPFAGDAFALLRQQVETPVPPVSQLNPAVSPTLEAIITRATQKNPADRYPSAGVMKAELERAALEATTGPTATLTADQPTVIRPSTPLPLSKTPTPQPAYSGSGPLPPPVYTTSPTPPPGTPLPAAPRKGGPGRIFVIGGIIGALLLCVCLGGGGLLAVSALLSEGTPTSTPVKQANVNETATTGPRTTSTAGPAPTATRPAATATRPAATPTPPPPIPTPIPVGRVIFEDDMRTNRNNWDVVNNSNVQSYFQTDGYHIVNTYQTNTNWQTVPGTGKNLTSFIYEVEFQKLDGPDNKSFGISFRLASLDGYDFLIRGNGTYSLGRYVEALEKAGQDGYDFMIEPTQAAPGMLNEGNARNRLKVAARGSEITLYINDKFVATVTETKPEARKDGVIGLVVGQGLHVVYTAVRVFELG